MENTDARENIKKSMAKKSHWHRRHFTECALTASIHLHSDNRSDILHIEKSFRWFVSALSRLTNGLRKADETQAHDLVCR